MFVHAWSDFFLEAPLFDDQNVQTLRNVFLGNVWNKVNHKCCGVTLES